MYRLLDVTYVLFTHHHLLLIRLCFIFVLLQVFLISFLNNRCYDRALLPYWVFLCLLLIISRHYVKVSSSEDVIECTLLKRPNTKISTYTTNSNTAFGKWYYVVFVIVLLWYSSSLFLFWRCIFLNLQYFEFIGYFFSFYGLWFSILCFLDHYYCMFPRGELRPVLWRNLLLFSIKKKGITW